MSVAAKATASGRGYQTSIAKLVGGTGFQGFEGLFRELILEIKAEKPQEVARAYTYSL